MPGYVQIVDTSVPDKGANPITPESLKAAGFNVPDFSKLPKGEYSYPEAVKMAEENQGSPDLIGAAFTEFCASNGCCVR